MRAAWRLGPERRSADLRTAAAGRLPRRRYAAAEVVQVHRHLPGRGAACLGCPAPRSSQWDGKEIYLEIQDKVTPMLVVHIGMMFSIPLMAVAVYLLLRGVERTQHA